MDADKKMIVIGAGPMGLATAYYALQAGYDVDLIEADDRPGGMAAHFDFDGLSIERFYHFCCLSDTDTFELMEELGIADQMRWVATKMGYYLDRQLFRWGDPIALLTAPKIDLITKIRYGVQMFWSTKRSDWESLDKISAKDWFEAWSGKRAYDRLWRRLLDLKFYEFSDNVSAAWIWQRIKRIGNSRKSLFEERLGYVNGGSETLMKALAGRIESLGGRIHYGVRATRFLIEGDKISGVEAGDGQTFQAPRVISTIPTPYVSDLFGEHEAALRAPYEAIENVGVVCVLLKLNRPVTDNFWVNVSDAEHDIPGFVEFSNLRPTGDDYIVYVPFYMPHTNAKFNQPDDAFVSESLACLHAVNPDISDKTVNAFHVARLQHAQPVCDIGFADKIPDHRTPISGLQIADTCFYYPEDRGVSESIKFAKKMINELG